MIKVFKSQWESKYATKIENITELMKRQKYAYNTNHKSIWILNFKINFIKNCLPIKSVKKWLLPAQAKGQFPVYQSLYYSAFSETLGQRFVSFFHRLTVRDVAFSLSLIIWLNKTEFAIFISLFWFDCSRGIDLFQKFLHCNKILMATKSNLKLSIFCSWYFSCVSAGSFK